MQELVEEHKSIFNDEIKRMLGSQIMSSLPHDVKQQFQLSTETLYPNLNKIFDKSNLVSELLIQEFLKLTQKILRKIILITLQI